MNALTELKVAVAFLGEKPNYNWWPSAFLDKTGASFLSPVFPKTSFLARVNGAAAAAQIKHDEATGVGKVNHLFRLGENLEQGIAQLLIDEPSKFELLTTKDKALQSIKDLAKDKIESGVGAFLIDSGDIDMKLSQMAAAYFNGFSNGEPVFPYFQMTDE